MIVGEANGLATCRPVRANVRYPTYRHAGLCRADRWCSDTAYRRFLRPVQCARVGLAYIKFVPGTVFGQTYRSDTSGGVPNHLLSDFRLLLLSATVATVVGALAVPTFQRILSRAVLHFQVHRSIPKLLLHGFARGGLSYIRDSVTPPKVAHIRDLRQGRELSLWVIGLNVAAQAMVTVAVFASLYAGALNPAYRVTASTLSSVVNGFATILLFVFIDPHLSIMTDDVVEGRTSEATFRRAVVWLAGTRVAGTRVAQAWPFLRRS